MVSISKLIQQIVRSPCTEIWGRRLIDVLDDVPYTKELDLHVGGKGSLELFAQLPALFIVLRVHLVCER